MKSATHTRLILDKLEAQHPDADTELHYTTPFQLLVATILSAQSTDQRVNLVTPALFKRYRNARMLARATEAALQPQIHSTGFFRAKSKSLIGMAKALVAEHGGEVPASMDALVKLPGVGRKTANVVLGHALGVPGLPVDRHVLRVANRIGIAESDSAEIVEQQLCDALPPERWTQTSDTLILHGRRICRPKPDCARCAVQEDCDYFGAVGVNSGGNRGATRGPNAVAGTTAKSAGSNPGHVGSGVGKGTVSRTGPARRNGRTRRRATLEKSARPPRK